MEQQNNPQTTSLPHEFDPEHEIDEYTQLVQQNHWQEITKRLCLQGKRLVWAGCLSFLEEVLDTLTTHGIVHPRVVLLYGDIFQTRGQLRDASDFFLQACSSSFENEHIHVEGWLKYGRICIRQGHIKEAETAFQTSYTKALQQHILWGEIHSLHALGDLQRVVGKLQCAENYYEQALARSQQAQESREIGFSLAHLGHICAAKGNVTAALDLYRKGLELVDQNEHRYMASLLEYVGWALQRQGEMSEALAMYEQSLALRTRNADLVGKALVLNKIGHFLYARHWRPLEEMAASSLSDPSLFAEKMEETPMAFPDADMFQAVQEKHQQCLELSREIGYTLGIIKALNALGVLHLYLKSSAEALPLLSEALTLCQESGEKLEEATTLENIGFVLYYIGNWDQATTSYKKSLHIHQEIGNPRDIAKLHIQFGRISMFQEDYVSLFTHFFTALAMTKLGGFDDAETRRHILFQRNQLKPKQFLSIAQKAKKHLAEELKPAIDLEELMAHWEVQDLTVRHETPKVGRNDPCPCGSGKKYKKCCGR